jgi:hypothetical protein
MTHSRSARVQFGDRTLTLDEQKFDILERIEWTAPFV